MTLKPEVEKALENAMLRGVVFDLIKNNLHKARQTGNLRDLFEYDIYGCPQNLKGQLKIGDFLC